MGGLFSSSNSRILTSDELRHSYSQDQLQQLHRVYNALKRNDSMSHAVFRRTFLPSNTPMMLSQKFYDVYAMTHSSREINFDDFAELNYLLKAPLGATERNTRAILYFYFIKMHGIVDPKQAQGPKGAAVDSFKPELFIYVGQQYLNITEEEILTFLTAQGVRLDQDITLDNFVKMYEANSEHVFFEWFSNIAKDYKGIMNCQFDPSQDQVQLSARVSPSTRKEIQQQNQFNAKVSQEAYASSLTLTMQSNSQQKEVESNFSETEQKLLRAFFYEQVVSKADLKDSLKVFDNLFKDLRLPAVLERRIIESFLYSNETNYFEWNSFLRIMATLTKRASDDEVIISYIFDIFSKYKPTILKDQLLQLAQIFMDCNERLKQDLQQCETLTKPQFVKLCNDISVNLHHFQKISTLFEIEFQMRSVGPERQLEVIRIELDGQLDIKEYFTSQLAVASSETKFYLLNKSFIQKWFVYVGLPNKESFSKPQLEKSASQMSSESTRVRKPSSIGNEALRSAQHQQQIRTGLLYGKDYLAVTPRIWKAFTNWYGRTTIFERKVIVYPLQDLSLRASSQLQGLQSQRNSNLNESQIIKSLDQLIYKDEVANEVHELEVDEIFIKCGRISDDGKLPSSSSLRDGAFSRKALLKYVESKLIDAFKNAQTGQQESREIRLWIGEGGPVDQIDRDVTLEGAGMRNGDKIFVEFRLESGEWPSARAQFEKGQIEASRTKGCTNLGNTCYMNSTLQCMAHSPFIREFFCGVPNVQPPQDNQAQQPLQNEADSQKDGADLKKNPPYKYQVNPNNVMGHNGDFVVPYAETMAKMWDSNSMFSVYPWGFKSSLGKVREQFQGRRQHDAHEFLMTLMDSLHEELNVRQKKPYIEAPDDRRDTLQVQNEFWANFLRRNWSFIVFLYYGQTYRRITCGKCLHTRVSYEVISNLSLPLPNSNTLLLPIVVNQIPSELAAILRKNFIERLSDVDSDFFNDQKSRELTLMRGKSFAVLEKADEFVKQQSKRERSILVNVAIDMGQTVAQLVKKVKTLSTIDIIGKVKVGGQEVELTKTLVYVYKDAKRQDTTLLFEDDSTLEDIRVSDRQALVISEELTEPAKQIIQEYYHSVSLEREEVKGQEEGKDTQLLRTQLDYTGAKTRPDPLWSACPI